MKISSLPHDRNHLGEGDIATNSRVCLKMKRVLIFYHEKIYFCLFFILYSCENSINEPIEPSFESNNSSLNEYSLSKSSQTIVDNLCTDKDFVHDISALNTYFNQQEKLYNTLVSSNTSQVRKVGGVITFSDLNSFLSTTNFIEQANEDWEELYQTKMNQLVNQIANHPKCGTPTMSSNEVKVFQEAIWDSLEENGCVNIPEDQASVSFEQKFNFNSLRKELFDAEERWLNNGGYANGTVDNPIYSTNFDYDVTTFITAGDPRLNITDLNLDHVNAISFGEILDLVTDFTGVVNGIAGVIIKLQQLLNDCSESTEAKVRRVKAKQGYHFYKDNKNRVIGYEMEQRSVTVDFDETTTKIKGKAKLYKEKRKAGRYKKDRSNRVGIQYCAREWNQCENKPWPADGSVYKSPRLHNVKKVKTGRNLFPYALTIKNSTEYLSFSFFFNENYETTKPLLSNVTTGCSK